MKKIYKKISFILIIFLFFGLSNVFAQKKKSVTELAVTKYELNDLQFRAANKTIDELMFDIGQKLLALVKPILHNYQLYNRLLISDSSLIKRKKKIIKNLIHISMFTDKKIEDGVVLYPTIIESFLDQFSKLGNIENTTLKSEMEENFITDNNQNLNGLDFDKLKVVKNIDNVITISQDIDADKQEIKLSDIFKRKFYLDNKDDEKFTKLKKKYFELQQAREELGDKKFELKKSFNKIQGEIEKLNNKSKEYENILQTYEDAIIKKTAKINKLKDDHQLSTKKVDELNTEVTKKTEEIKQLEIQKQEIQNKQDEIDKGIKVLKGQDSAALTQLKNELTILKEQKKKNEKQIKKTVESLLSEEKLLSSKLIQRKSSFGKSSDLLNSDKLQRQSSTGNLSSSPIKQKLSEQQSDLLILKLFKGKNGRVNINPEFIDNLKKIQNNEHFEFNLDKIFGGQDVIAKLKSTDKAAVDDLFVKTINPALKTISDKYEKYDNPTAPLIAVKSKSKPVSPVPSKKSSNSALAQVVIDPAKVSAFVEKAKKLEDEAALNDLKSDEDLDGKQDQLLIEDLGKIVFVNALKKKLASGVIANWNIAVDELKTHDFINDQQKQDDFNPHVEKINNVLRLQEVIEIKKNDANSKPDEWYLKNIAEDLYFADKKTEFLNENLINNINAFISDMEIISKIKDSTNKAIYNISSTESVRIQNLNKKIIVKRVKKKTGSGNILTWENLSLIDFNNADIKMKIKEDNSCCYLSLDTLIAEYKNIQDKIAEEIKKVLGSKLNDSIDPLKANINNALDPKLSELELKITEEIKAKYARDNLFVGGGAVDPSPTTALAILPADLDKYKNDQNIVEEYVTQISEQVKNDADIKKQTSAIVAEQEKEDAFNLIKTEELKEQLANINYLKKLKDGIKNAPKVITIIDELKTKTKEEIEKLGLDEENIKKIINNFVQIAYKEQEIGDKQQLKTALDAANLKLQELDTLWTKIQKQDDLTTTALGGLPMPMVGTMGGTTYIHLFKNENDVYFVQDKNTKKYISIGNILNITDIYKDTKNNKEYILHTKLKEHFDKMHLAAQQAKKLAEAAFNNNTTNIKNATEEKELIETTNQLLIDNLSKTINDVFTEREQNKEKIKQKIKIKELEEQKDIQTEEIKNIGSQIDAKNKEIDGTKSKIDTFNLEISNKEKEIKLNEKERAILENIQTNLTDQNNAYKDQKEIRLKDSTVKEKQEFLNKQQGENTNKIALLKLEQEKIEKILNNSQNININLDSDGNYIGTSYTDKNDELQKTYIPTTLEINSIIKNAKLSNTKILKNKYQENLDKKELLLTSFNDDFTKINEIFTNGYTITEVKSDANGQFTINYTDNTASLQTYDIKAPGMGPIIKAEYDNKKVLDHVALETAYDAKKNEIENQIQAFKAAGEKITDIITNHQVTNIDLNADRNYIGISYTNNTDKKETTYIPTTLAMNSIIKQNTELLKTVALKNEYNKTVAENTALISSLDDDLKAINETILGAGHTITDVKLDNNKYTIYHEKDGANGFYEIKTLVMGPIILEEYTKTKTLDPAILGNAYNIRKGEITAQITKLQEDWNEIERISDGGTKAITKARLNVANNYEITFKDANGNFETYTTQTQTMGQIVSKINSNVLLDKDTLEKVYKHHLTNRQSLLTSFENDLREIDKIFDNRNVITKIKSDANGNSKISYIKDDGNKETYKTQTSIMSSIIKNNRELLDSTKAMNEYNAQKAKIENQINAFEKDWNEIETNLNGDSNAIKKVELNGDNNYKITFDNDNEVTTQTPMMASIIEALKENKTLDQQNLKTAYNAQKTEIDKQKEEFHQDWVQLIGIFTNSKGISKIELNTNGQAKISYIDEHGDENIYTTETSEIGSIIKKNIELLNQTNVTDEYKVQKEKITKQKEKFEQDWAEVINILNDGNFIEKKIVNFEKNDIGITFKDENGEEQIYISTTPEINAVIREATDAMFPEIIKNAYNAQQKTINSQITADQKELLKLKSILNEDQSNGQDPINGLTEALNLKQNELDQIKNDRTKKKLKLKKEKEALDEHFNNDIIKAGHSEEIAKHLNKLFAELFQITGVSGKENLKEILSIWDQKLDGEQPDEKANTKEIQQKFTSFFNQLKNSGFYQNLKFADLSDFATYTVVDKDVFKGSENDNPVYAALNENVILQIERDDLQDENYFIKEKLEHFKTYEFNVILDDFKKFIEEKNQLDVGFPANKQKAVETLKKLIENKIDPKSQTISSNSNEIRYFELIMNELDNKSNLLNISLTINNWTKNTNITKYEKEFLLYIGEFIEKKIEEIHKLISNNDQLAENITELNTEILVKKKLIEEMEKEKKELNKKNNDLEKENVDLVKNLEDLQNKKKSLEHEKESFEKLKIQLQAENHTLKSGVSGENKKLIGEKDKLKQSHDDFIKAIEKIYAGSKAPAPALDDLTKIGDAYKTLYNNFETFKTTQTEFINKIANMYTGDPASKPDSLGKIEDEYKKLVKVQKDLGIFISDISTNFGEPSKAFKELAEVKSLIETFKTAQDNLITEINRIYCAQTVSNFSEIQTKHKKLYDDNKLLITAIAGTDGKIQDTTQAIDAYKQLITVIDGAQNTTEAIKVHTELKTEYTNLIAAMHGIDSSITDAATAISSYMKLHKDQTDFIENVKRINLAKSFADLTDIGNDYKILDAANKNLISDKEKMEEKQKKILQESANENIKFYMDHLVKVQEQYIEAINESKTFLQKLFEENDTAFGEINTLFDEINAIPNNKDNAKILSDLSIVIPKLTRTYTPQTDLNQFTAITNKIKMLENKKQEVTDQINEINRESDFTEKYNKINELKAISADFDKQVTELDQFINEKIFQDRVKNIQEYNDYVDDKENSVTGKKSGLRETLSNAQTEISNEINNPKKGLDKTKLETLNQAITKKLTELTTALCKVSAPKHAQSNFELKEKNYFKFNYEYMSKINQGIEHNNRELYMYNTDAYTVNTTITKIIEENKKSKEFLMKILHAQGNMSKRIMQKNNKDLSKITKDFIETIAITGNDLEADFKKVLDELNNGLENQLVLHKNLQGKDLVDELNKTQQQKINGQDKQILQLESEIQKQKEIYQNIRTMLDKINNIPTVNELENIGFSSCKQEAQDILNLYKNLRIELLTTNTNKKEAEENLKKMKKELDDFIENMEQLRNKAGVGAKIENYTIALNEYTNALIENKNKQNAIDNAEKLKQEFIKTVDKFSADKKYRNSGEIIEYSHVTDLYTQIHTEKEDKEIKLKGLEDEKTNIISRINGATNKSIHGATKYEEVADKFIELYKNNQTNKKEKINFLAEMNKKEKPTSFSEKIDDYSKVQSLYDAQLKEKQDFMKKIKAKNSTINETYHDIANSYETIYDENENNKTAKTTFINAMQSLDSSKGMGDYNEIQAAYTNMQSQNQQQVQEIQQLTNEKAQQAQQIQQLTTENTNYKTAEQQNKDADANLIAEINKITPNINVTSKTEIPSQVDKVYKEIQSTDQKTNDQGSNLLTRQISIADLDKLQDDAKKSKELERKNRELEDKTHRLENKSDIDIIKERPKVIAGVLSAGVTVGGTTMKLFNIYDNRRKKALSTQNIKAVRQEDNKTILQDTESTPSAAPAQ